MPSVLQAHRNARSLYLELGVGYNTPGIIKFNCWNLTLQNSRAFYVFLNKDVTEVPEKFAGQALSINDDIGTILNLLKTQPVVMTSAKNASNYKYDHDKRS